MRSRKPAMAFIFITVLLDMIAFGIIVPSFNPLVLAFMHGNYTNASLLNGVFSTIFAVMQLFSSPLLGTLSDRYGRRPVILLSNAGTALDYAILALAPNLAWLFIGRVLSGATTASVTVASAYIADVTPAEKRAGAYGMISAAFGIGFVVGPALGGLLAVHGLRAPFWVAGILSLVNFAYGAFVLPESLAESDRNAFDLKRANPLGSLKMLRRHRELTGLSWASTFVYIGGQTLPQLWVFYVMLVFGWSSNTIGLSLAVVGVCTIAVSALVIGPAVKAWGERRALVAGLLLGAIGFFMYASHDQRVFWLAIPVSMLSMIGGSALSSLMTKRVGKNEQGELQGAINLLRSVGMIVGPPLFTVTFAYSISTAHAWRAPGAGWIIGGLLYVVATIIAWKATGRGDDDAGGNDIDRDLQATLGNEASIATP